MKKQIFFIMMMLFPFCVASIAATPEEIAEKSLLSRKEIIKKDEERRAKILKKFSDFQAKVKNFAPDMKVNIPIHPDKAEDILDLDNDSEIKKQEKYFAFAAESYKLRVLPYDSIKEYTSTVSRGDRITVLMKPDLKKDKSHPSITKDWLLIRTSDGVEGYIPLNLVLNKKPEKIKKSSFNPDKRFYPGNNYGLKDEYSNGTEADIFILAQYSGDDSSSSGEKKMKVNTSSLKVRVEPALDSESIYSLSKNDIVEVLEYSSHTDYYAGNYSKWARIKMDDVEGWVFAYYLTEVQGGAGGVSGSEEYVSHLDKGADLYVKSDILRVRDAPDDYSTVLFSLQNKDKVEVTDVEPDEVTLGGKKSKWVKIKYLDYDGWVFGAFLSRDKNAFEEGDSIDSLFQIPVSDNYFISSKFGKRILKGKVSNHTGVDFAAPCGTNVVAAADGNVIMVVEDSRNCSSCGYGSYAIIEHKNGYRTVYGHLTSVKVKTGDKVNSGEKVGTVGNTGHSYGCHLHFEIRAYEEFVDPLNYMHP